MKFGQVLAWKLVPGPFMILLKMTLQPDLAIFNGWHMPFLIVLYSPFQKKWNTGILTYLVIE